MDEYIPLDRVDQAELRTDLHFAKTSSMPIKATLKVVKIDIFSQQKLQEERKTDKKYFNNSLLNLDVNANRRKSFKIG